MSTSVDDMLASVLKGREIYASINPGHRPGAHIVRATLEGIAFRTRDVLEAMKSDTGQEISMLKVDGGASANGFLMQALADIFGVEVRIAAVRETTALDVAFLAGLGCGLWNSQ